MFRPFAALHNYLFPEPPPPPPLAQQHALDLDATALALHVAECELERAIANRNMLTVRLKRLKNDNVC